LRCHEAASHAAELRRRRSHHYDSYYHHISATLFIIADADATPLPPNAALQYYWHAIIRSHATARADNLPVR